MACPRSGATSAVPQKNSTLIAAGIIPALVIGKATGTRIRASSARIDEVLPEILGARS